MTRLKGSTAVATVCEHRSFTVNASHAVGSALCCDCREEVQLFPIIEGSRFKIVILEEDYRG